MGSNVVGAAAAIGIVTTVVMGSSVIGAAIGIGIPVVFILRRIASERAHNGGSD